MNDRPPPLIELPDGQWVDPDAVLSIAVQDAVERPGCEKPARVVIRLRARRGKPYVAVESPSLREAEVYAGWLGRKVNESRRGTP